MDSSIGISLIIPVYNTEAYLHECLDSVREQQFDNIEVLCIDDGSTDDSLKILNEYARGDDRFHILTPEVAGGGPGAARNLGIDRARGEFIAFVDSDDYLHPNFLRRLYEQAVAAKTDIVMCLVSKFDDAHSGTQYAPCTYDRYISTELDGSVFTWRDLADPFSLRYVAWNKLYRKAFLDRNAIRFSEGIFFEDMIFTFRALLQAEGLMLVRDSLYFNRRQRQGATTYQQSSRVFGTLAAMEQVEEFLESHAAYRILDERFAAFRFTKLVQYLHRNDVEHMPRFYNELKDIASDKSLTTNPYLSEHELLQRRMILECDLLSYLAWEIWDTKTRFADMRRQRNHARRKNKQMRRQMNRSVLFRVEMAVRRRLSRLKRRGETAA